MKIRITRMSLLPTNQIPLWIEVLAEAYLLIGFASAFYTIYDMFANKHRMHMRIMEWVWPVTAFYFWPVALWAFWHMGHLNLRNEGSGSTMHNKAFGDNKQTPEQAENQQAMAGQHLVHPHDIKKKGEKPLWETVFISDTHCGAGCTLGDVMAEWVIVLTGIVLVSGVIIWTRYILDFIFAYGLGIVFQYFPIKQMEKSMSRGNALVHALKADTISLMSFEIGLFGWMAFVTFEIFGRVLHPMEPVFWFMMQIGMIIGFWTSHLPNWWLVKKGVKKGM